MNYELEVMSSNPLSFSPLNGNLPPLVAGSGSAALMATYENANFEAFNRGYESIPFTLEVWFRPLTNTGEIVVIGHTNEGVIWNGTDFVVRIRQDAGITEFTWTPKEIKAFHLALVYTPGQALFYVDGVVVGSIDLPTSPFTSTGASVRIHNGTGTGVYDSMALYARALPVSEIAAHYLWGKSVRIPTQVASANGGTTWTLMHQDSDIYATVTFDADDWSNFLLDGLGLVSDTLFANEGGGTWTGSVPLASIVGGVAAGVSLTYEGYRVVLSYSTDATTWTPVMNGAIVLEEIDVTDKNLFLRVDLPDEGWIDSLSVSVLNDRSLTPASGIRELAYKGAILDHETVEPLDYMEAWGAVIKNGAYLEINPEDGSNPTNIATIEVWAKVDDTDGFIINPTGGSYVAINNNIYNFNAVVAYRNGVPVTNGAFPRGEWAHWVFVLNAPANLTTRIGQVSNGTDQLNLTIGHIATYDYKFTAAQASALYKANVGSPLLRVDDTSVVSVTEQATPIKIYAQSWSYLSSVS